MVAHPLSAVWRPKVRTMTAPHRTGHVRTIDGGVVRVDLERGRWVATRYSACHIVTEQLYGGDVEIHEQVARWIA